MVEWTEDMRGAFFACVAEVAGCDLSIIGRTGAWFWLVSHGDDDLAEGMEPDLADAQRMAEVVARGLGVPRPPTNPWNLLTEPPEG